MFTCLENRRNELENRHFSGQNRVSSELFRKNDVLPTRSELLYNFVREELSQLRSIGNVLEGRYTDDLDVGGQKITPARQAVSTARRNESQSEREDVPGDNSIRRGDRQSAEDTWTLADYIVADGRLVLAETAR